ncbi:hypothetical protein V1282_005382 [Nitrobacteraceae bacterium AZCC 2146]
MFGRKSENAKRLDAAKIDVAAARVRAATIAAGEEAALENAATYAAWRTERDTATADVERLEKLIAALTAGGEAQRQHDAEEALRRRIDLARKNNAALAERIKIEGSRLSVELKALIRDAAAATLETDAINKLLPDGTPPLLDPNFIARGRPAVPRKDLEEKVLNLWVRETDGSLIGDQDRVTAVDADTGNFVVDKQFRVDCVRRKFRSTTYHPVEYAEIPEHLFANVRLPLFDRQGVDFDGARFITEHVAMLEAEPAKLEKKAARRPTQTELAPVEPYRRLEPDAA